MGRLSQEDIDEILSQTKHAPFPTPEPSPSMSPEKLEDLRGAYRSMNEMYDSSWASFCEFRDWVRGELAAKGFVEVDDAYLADRAQVRAELEEEEKEWAKMLEEQPELARLLIGEDDDDCMVVGVSA